MNVLWNGTPEARRSYLRVLLNKEALPGTMVSYESNGHGYKWDTSQERYTFATYLYYEGIVPGKHTFRFQILTDAEWDAHTRMQKKFASGGVKSFPTPITVTNGFLRRSKVFSVILENFGDVIPATSGGVHGSYTVSLFRYYSPRWRPKPPKEEDGKSQKPVDAKLNEDRAIKPSQELNTSYENARVEALKLRKGYK